MKVLLASDGFVTDAVLRTALARALPDVETASISSTWPVPPFRDIGDVREAAGDEDELIEALDGCDVAFSHTFPFTEKVVAASPSLKLVTICRGGPVNVNIEAATRAGVLVSYTPGRNATATAEHTVGMILASLRQIPQRHREVVDGQWRSDYYIFDNVGAEIGSSTVGVVGYGAVGRRVAAVMAAFGARVLVYDPWTDEPAEGMTSVDSLGELLAGSDVVTIAPARGEAACDPLCGTECVSRGGLFRVTTRDGSIRPMGCRGQSPCHLGQSGLPNGLGEAAPDRAETL